MPFISEKIKIHIDGQLKEIDHHKLMQALVFFISDVLVTLPAEVVDRFAFKNLSYFENLYEYEGSLTLFCWN